jgi:heptosyltransferase-2
VLAIPAVRALAGRSRQGELLALASASSREIFLRLPGVLAVTVARPGDAPLGSLGAVLRGSAALRNCRPELVVSFTRSFTSAATCYLGRVPERVGFADSAGAFLYTKKVNRPPSRKVHLTDVYCRLAEALGLGIVSRLPRLEPLPEDLARGEEAIRRKGVRAAGFVCLFPGARYGPSKRWQSARFALLGDAVVANLGLDVVLLGGREDRQACADVRSQMTRRSVDLAGECGFSALVGCLALSRAVVANDSGGMHLAGALGVPVVGLFFSTDPEWTGPRSPKSAVLYRKTDCSPCFKRDCALGVKCTETIGVEDVLEALTALLGRVS